MIKPYYQDESCTIYNADCRDVLPQLEAVDLVLKNGENLAPSVLQSEHENHQTRRIQANTGSGEMGEIAARNRMALPFSELVTGQDCSVFQGFTDSHEQGLKETEDQITRARTAGRTERAIQGRVTEHLLPSDDSERQMLEMRRDGKPCNSSQEFQSSRQSLRKSSGSLRQLPQSASQNALVAASQILLLTDPPYGIGADIVQYQRGGTQRGKASAASKQYGFSDWDSAKPDISLLDDFRSISKYQIIFGGNHFALPPSTCWLVWDKLTGANKYADCELAWTNLQGTVRKFTYLWNGMLQGDMAHKEVRQHPTQKPLALMKWCLSLVPDAKVILDPFMGSGTTLRAAKDLGLRAIGIEIEQKYCDIAIERLRQQVLFGEAA